MSYSEYKRRYGKDAYTFWKYDHRMSGMYGGKRKFPQRRVQSKRIFRRSFTPRSRNVVMIQPRQRGALRVGGYYGRYSNGGELKFHDVDVDDAVISSGGTVQTAGTINVIPQGVTEITRVGRKCTIRSINWRYTVTIPEAVEQATPVSPDTLGRYTLLDFLTKRPHGYAVYRLDDSPAKPPPICMDNGILSFVVLLLVLLCI